MTVSISRTNAPFPGLEKLLRKMILPNADLRITAPVALNDPYFALAKPETPRTCLFSPTYFCTLCRAIYVSDCCNVTIPNSYRGPQVHINLSLP